MNKASGNGTYEIKQLSPRMLAFLILRMGNGYVHASTVSLKLNEVFLRFFKNNGKKYKNGYNVFCYGGIFGDFGYVIPCNLANYWC